MGSSTGQFSFSSSPTLWGESEALQVPGGEGCPVSWPPSPLIGAVQLPQLPSPVLGKQSVWWRCVSRTGLCRPHRGSGPKMGFPSSESSTVGEWSVGTHPEGIPCPGTTLHQERSQGTISPLPSLIPTLNQRAGRPDPLTHLPTDLSQFFGAARRQGGQKGTEDTEAREMVTAWFRGGKERTAPALE